MQCRLTEYDGGFLDGPTDTESRAIRQECKDRCQDLIDQSVREGGEVDNYYPKSPGKCPACGGTEVEFSHDALYQVDAQQRRYVIVHLCTGCGDEQFEEDYVFTCPYAS